MIDIDDALTEYGAEWRAVQPPFTPAPTVAEPIMKHVPLRRVASLVATGLVAIGALLIVTRSDSPAIRRPSVQSPASAPPSTAPTTSASVSPSAEGALRALADNPAASAGPSSPPASSDSGTADAPPPPPPPPPSPPPPAGADLARVYADAIASRDVGQQLFPEVYGGIELTNDQTHIAVYLTVVDPQVQAAIIGEADPNEYTFHITSASEAQQAALRDRIVMDDDVLASEGITVYLVSPELRSGKVTIGIQTLTPQAQQTLEARYGATNITVTEAQPATATAA